MKRLAAIDALRGVALLLMVVDHCFDWWLAETYRDTWVDSLTEFLGTLAAPIFVLLVGVGLALSLHRGRQRGFTLRRLAPRLVRRGLFLIAMGYVLNFVVFFTGSNWSDVFAVDVLHLIGLGIIAGVPVAWFLGPVAALALAVVWAVAGALWGGDFTLPPVLGAWVNARTGTGYFPILPWLAYVWLGVAAGKWLWQRNQAGDNDPRPLAGRLGVIALGWFVLILVVPNAGYRHPRLAFMCLSLALLFGVWALLQGLDNLGQLPRRAVVWPLALMGQTAFMLYALHHLIGYRLFYHLGWVSGRSWQGHYGALSPLQALIGFIGMVAVCYLASGPWLRVRDRVQSMTIGRMPGFSDLRL